MRKGTIKAIVLPVVFVLAVIIFSLMTNKTNEDLTTEMSDATLPVVTLYDGNTAVNELHGYIEKMSAAYMRDRSHRFRKTAGLRQRSRPIRQQLTEYPMRSGVWTESV